MKTFMPGIEPPARLLLLGASGRVGRMVAYHLDAGGAGAVDLVCQHRSMGHADAGTLVWSPLEGPDALLRFLKDRPAFDAVVALVGVTPQSGQPLADNTALAEACLDAAYRAGTRRVLLASSSAVYGAGSPEPIREEAPLLPANPYGAAKVHMEEACQPWRARGLEVCCLRIGNVAGADQLLLNARQALHGTTPSAIRLDIFADGHGPLRSYIGPGTLAAVLRALALSDRALPEALNIAAPTPVWMEDLLAAAGCRFEAIDATGKGHQVITLDCDRLAQFYRFSPGDSLPGTMVQQWRDTL